MKGSSKTFIAALASASFVSSLSIHREALSEIPCPTEWENFFQKKCNSFSSDPLGSLLYNQEILTMEEGVKIFQWTQKDYTSILLSNVWETLHNEITFVHGAVLSLKSHPLPSTSFNLTPPKKTRMLSKTIVCFGPTRFSKNHLLLLDADYTPPLSLLSCEEGDTISQSGLLDNYSPVMFHAY